MVLNIFHLLYKLMENRNYRKEIGEVFTFREYKHRIVGYNQVLINKSNNIKSTYFSCFNPLNVTCFNDIKMSRYNRKTVKPENVLKQGKSCAIITWLIVEFVTLGFDYRCKIKSSTYSLKNGNI